MARRTQLFNRKDFGISSVIAPSFGEIFRSNSLQNGLVPVQLSPEACKELYEEAVNNLEIEVDLEALEVRRASGKPPFKFTLEPERRHRLLNGLDDIALTLQKASAIDEFEARRSELWPWLDGFGYVKGGGRIDAKTVKGNKKLDW